LSLRDGGPGRIWTYDQWIM